MHGLILTATLLLFLTDLTPRTSATIVKKRRKDYENSLPRQLGMGYGQSVLKLNKADTLFGTSIWRLRPTCHGIPFINSDFEAEFKDGNYNGRSNTPKLPPCDSPVLLEQLRCPPLLKNPKGVAKLEKYKARYLSTISASQAGPKVFMNQKVERRLEYLEGAVKLVDKVDVLWEGPSFTARVFIVMDACDSTLLHIFNLLALGSIEDSSSWAASRQKRSSIVKRTANPKACAQGCPRGQGGNNVVGIVQFGPGADQVCLDASARNGQFFLENQYVVVHDSRDRPSPKTPCQDIPVVCFDCQSSPNDGINGGRSPSYDAIYAVGVIRNVINEWYPEVAPDLFQPLHVCTHFGRNYTNSVWTGRSILLGDGVAGRAHPFTTLDVMAHEFGHYLTETYSRLILQGEAGGVQDAFSDGFAKVLDAYTNDGRRVRSWEVGPGILTGDRHRPIRYMDTPTKDGNSIDQASKITSGMDSHFACGVFNRFFHCMVQTKGVSVRDTFLLYLMSNKVRWDVYVTFKEAACHVLHSAYDQGINTLAAASCFRHVGVLTSHSQCSILSSIRTLCANGYVTVQASLNRQPYFKVCKSSSRAFRIYLLSTANVSVSQGSPYSPKKRYTKACGGILQYTGSLDGNIYIRVAGTSDSLQTVRFAIRFGPGKSRPRSGSKGSGSRGSKSKGSGSKGSGSKGSNSKGSGSADVDDNKKPLPLPWWKGD